MSYKYNVAVIIGSFHFPDLGHQRLLSTPLSLADKVVVVVTEWQAYRTPYSPFTADERIQMLTSMLTPKELERVSFERVRDYPQEHETIAEITKRVNSQIAATDEVVHIGMTDSDTSRFEGKFQFWPYLNGGRNVMPPAKTLSTLFFKDETLADAEPCLVSEFLSSYLHPGVVEILSNWDSERFNKMKSELTALLRYKADYPGPYYLTADSVVLVNDHVLLIKRGGEFGRGSWALPGGFMDENETFLETALRELAEETGLALSDLVLKQSLTSQRVFDSPKRSLRGRIISQAFFFDVGVLSRFPDIKAADDAKEARWVPVFELTKLEGNLFEDHASIINHFIPFQQV